MKTTVYTSLFFITILFSTHKSFAHCQIPCGIYNDSLRVELIEEHIITIEKSMHEIHALSKESDLNYNQITRWINNKELHATKVQSIISDYFLLQRIKPVSKENHHYSIYIKNLEYLHLLSVFAMKAKQTTDLLFVQEMRKTLKAFSDHYFSEHKH